MNPPTTLATLLLALHRHLVERGIDADRLFEAAGVDPRLLLQPGARVRSDLVNRVWRLAEAETGDECIGLEVARHVHPSVADALGYAWLASVTLREGMTRLARYMRIVAGIARVRFREAPAGGELVFEPAALPPGRHDAFYGTVVRYCRASRGPGFRPLALALTRGAPADPARHERLFECPIAFGAPESVLLLPHADLDARLPTASPEVAAMTERLLESQLARADRQDLVAQLQARILDALPSGPPTEEQVARGLALSQRTLQRRLAAVGTTYGDVLDRMRHELALHHLRDAQLQISEIAYLLGFAEAASFNRAFRRWTGRTPSEYRAGLDAAAVSTLVG
jgi:AraC-like DNA-binding protein